MDVESSESIGQVQGDEIEESVEMAYVTFSSGFSERKVFPESRHIFH
jgi:hypothetical protein